MCAARQIGAERFNLFKECEGARSATLILRGGAEQFIDETERSIHGPTRLLSRLQAVALMGVMWCVCAADSLMIVKNCVKSSRIVAGGGAIELEISRYLKEVSLTIPGAAPHLACGAVMWQQCC